MAKKLESGSIDFDADKLANAMLKNGTNKTVKTVDIKANMKIDNVNLNNFEKQMKESMKKIGENFSNLKFINPSKQTKAYDKEGDLKSITAQIEAEVAGKTKIYDITTKINKADKEWYTTLKESTSLQKEGTKELQQYEAILNKKLANEKKEFAARNSSNPADKKLAEQYALENIELTKKQSLLARHINEKIKMGVLESNSLKNIKEEYSRRSGILALSQKNKLAQTAENKNATIKAKLENEIYKLKKRQGDLDALLQTRRKTPEIEEAAKLKIKTDSLIKSYEDLAKSQIITGDASNNLTKDIHNQSNAISKAQTGIISQGKWLLNFKDSFTNAFRSFSTYLSVTTVFYAITRSIKDMVTQVSELDKSFTELKKVTDLTNKDMQRVFKESAEVASKTAKTISEAIDAKTEFAKAGYDDSDTKILSENALMWTNIADSEVKASDAAGIMISQMKAFNIEAKDSSKIIDAMNEVSNKYAVSSSDLSDNIGKVSSVLANANVSFEETLGLMTAGTEITRDASKIANGLKTISLRLQGMSDEGEEDLELIPKLQTELAKINVTMMDSEGNLKNTYEIMKDISVAYKTLTAGEKAYYTELIAGKYQAQTASAILKNFEVAIDATSTALDSNGSAIRENANVLDSIEGKMAAVDAAWQTLSSNLINSKFVKGFYSSVKVILDFFNSDFGQGTLKVIALAGAFGGLYKILRIGKEAWITNTDALKSHLIIKNLLINTNQKAILSSAKLTAAEKVEELALTGLTKAEAENLVSSTELAVANTTLSASFKTATIAAGKFLLALAANPVTWIVAALATIVAVGNALTTTVEEQNQLYQNAKDKYEETKSSLEGVNSELKTTKDRMAELQSKGTLTFVEKSELSNLQQVNRELEKKKTLLEVQERADKATKSKEAKKTYEKEFQGLSTDDGVFSFFPALFKQDKNLYEESHMFNMENAFDTQEDFINKTIKKYQELKKTGQTMTPEFKKIEEYLTITGGKFGEFAKDIGEGTEEGKNFTNAYNTILSVLDPDKFKALKFDEITKDDKNKGAMDEIAGLSNAYKLTEDSLKTLLDKYPELKKQLDESGISAKDFIDNLDKAPDVIKNSTESIDTLSDSLNDLKSSFDLISDVEEDLKENKIITADTITSIVDKYKDLEDEMADYAAGLLTEAQILDILKAKNKEEEDSFRNSIAAKLMLSNNFYQVLLTQHSDLMTSISEKYGIDLANFTDAEKLKIEMSAKAKTLLNGMDFAQLAVLAENYGIDVENFSEGQKKHLDIMAKATKGQLDYADWRVISQSALYGKDVDNFANAEKLKLEIQKKVDEDVSKDKSAIDALAKQYVGKSGNIGKISAELRDSSKKDAKETKDAWKEAYDKELKDLQYARDKGLITEKEYYNQLESLNNKYFAGKDKYLDEYRKNEIDILNARKKFIKDDFDSELKELQYYLDKKYISETEYFNRLDALNQKYFANNKDYLDEYRQYQLEVEKGLLDEKQKLYESAHQAVIDSIDNEIKKLEDNKKAIEDKYNAEIDALKEKNDEQDRAIELAKAEERLANAKKEKNKRVYREGLGWVWEADQKEIDDASKDLDDIKTDNEIKDLEDKRDKELEIIESQIESWNKYKEQWAETVDFYQKEADKLAAAQLLGVDWEKKMLEDKLANAQSVYGQYLGMLQKFYSEYTKIQENINNVKGLPNGLGDTSQVLTKAGANRTGNSIPSYKNGVENGLIDYTGLAMVHGSPNSPEGAFNGKQALSILKNMATGNWTSKGSNNNGNNYSYNFDKLVLPNVKNPRQFLNELKILVNTN